MMFLLYFLQFYNDMVKFVIEITLIAFIQKKVKVDIFPDIQYLHNLYNY